MYLLSFKVNIFKFFSRKIGYWIRLFVCFDNSVTAQGPHMVHSHVLFGNMVFSKLEFEYFWAGSIFHSLPQSSPLHIVICSPVSAVSLDLRNFKVFIYFRELGLPSMTNRNPYWNVKLPSALFRMDPPTCTLPLTYTYLLSIGIFEIRALQNF